MASRPDEKTITETSSGIMEKVLSYDNTGTRTGSIVPAEILEHSHDADEAMKAFAEMQGVSLEMDEATNKRLLRKIDRNLLPVSAMSMYLPSVEC